MINQYEVPAYLVDELPEIRKELRKAAPTLNVFKSIQCLTDYTKQKAADHDLLMVRKCFSAAEKIYLKGNAIVKNAIENVFIFSLSSLLHACSRNEYQKMQAIMPVCLYTAYVQQIIKSNY